METMRAKAKNKYIWVDETTESDQRIIANFIFGLMEINENSIERGKCYLLNIAVFYKANANSVSKSSILYRYYIQKVKSVHKRKKKHRFWFKTHLDFAGLEYNKVLLVTTDAASYMLSSMRALKTIFGSLHTFHSSPASLGTFSCPALWSPH